MKTESLVWTYTDGYRIERRDLYYVVIGPAGQRESFGSLGACDEWLQSRKHFPVIESKNK